MTEFQLANNKELDYNYQDALQWVLEPNHPDHLARLQSLFPHLTVSSHSQLQQVMGITGPLPLLFLPFAVGHNVFFYLMINGYYPIIATTNMKKQFQSYHRIQPLLRDLNIYSYLIVRYYGNSHGQSASDEIMLLINYLFYRFHDLGITSYGRGVGYLPTVKSRYQQCVRIINSDQTAYDHYLLSHFPLTIENFRYCELLLADIIDEWNDRYEHRPEGL